MAAPLMQMGVLVTPYINQQGFNAMAKSQGANFAAQFQNGMTKAAQPLGRITGQVSEFEKSMAAANARVLAFGASAGSIYLVKDAFEKMISSTIEVEKSLANINTVLQLGQSALKTFSSEMFKAASQTGQTFKTASEVALEFARHGVSATETARRMTSAMQLMRISGLDAQDSVNAITAAINAFNKEGLSSVDIVNRLTAVDTKFAVSAQDLAKAVERVGSTATEAGVKFNQLLGLVTAVQTATARGGAVIGNAFKSIFTRLARPEVLNDLEAIGVTTRNASGQILPMVELLKKLASQYNTLNYAQKSFVTEAVGGVYQVNILKASLADLGRGFSIYDKAAITASQSTGLIEQRMASLNDTIASKLNTTTLQFTRLVSSFGATAFGTGAKSSLDSFNKQVENIGNGLDDIAEKSSFGEKVGHSLAQGVSKGIGDIISGPGIQIAMALVTKIAKGLGSFAIQSSREFMGLNEPLKQQAAVQQSITGFLQQNVSLMNQWAKGQLSLNNLVGIYLQSMKNASIYQGQMANMVGGATPIVSPSVHVSHATPYSGFVPNFSVPNARQEYMGALASGYKPGRIYQERIEGLGYVTMNGAETVKKFDGMSQKAILPPKNSRAGDRYQKTFQSIHGFDPYASDGYVPNFGLMNMLSGLGGIGGNLLPKQNLPADISEQQLEAIYLQYARAMYNPKAGKTPIGLNLFANKAFHSSYVEKEGNYVFGQHDNNVFLPTHFAPKSKLGGLSIMKDMKNYDNIVMAVTKDLSGLLQKAGYSAIKENVPVSFRDGEAIKDILVSNKLRTPVLAAGMFAALSTGNAKPYFEQHGGRSDNALRQIYFGEMGKTHNAVNYLQSKGFAADGIIPSIDNFGSSFGLPTIPTEKKVHPMQKLHAMHAEVVAKMNAGSDDAYTAKNKFEQALYDTGFEYGEYNKKSLADSLFYSSVSDKHLKGYFNWDNLAKNGISRENIISLLSKKNKIKTYNPKGYNEYYDLEAFQKKFTREKDILSKTRQLESHLGFKFKDAGIDHLTYMRYLTNPNLTDNDRQYYIRTLQKRVSTYAATGYSNIYGDDFKTTFKKGAIDKVNKAFTSTFGLDKLPTKNMKNYLETERQFLKRTLGFSNYDSDPLLERGNRRKGIAKILGKRQKLENLQKAIPGFNITLPTKADIISGNESYLSGEDIFTEAGYIKPDNSPRYNFDYLRNTIAHIQDFVKNGQDKKDILRNLPSALSGILPNNVNFSPRQISRAFINSLRLQGKDVQAQFRKGDEYGSKSAAIWEARKKVASKFKGMTRELFRPSVEVPSEYEDNYNHNITPSIAFNISKRNLSGNVFRGVNAIEKLYAGDINKSDLVFRGAGVHEFALLQALGAFTSVGQRTDERKAGAYVTSSLMKSVGYAISSQFEGRPGAVGIYSKAGLSQLGSPMASAAGNEGYNSLRFPKLGTSALMGVLDLERGRILKLQQYLSQFGGKIKLSQEFLDFNKNLNAIGGSQTLNMPTPVMPHFSGGGVLNLFRKIGTRNRNPQQPNFRGPNRPLTDEAKEKLMKASVQDIVAYIHASLQGTEPGVIPFGSDASTFFDLRSYRPISRNFRKNIESGRYDIKNFDEVIYHKKVNHNELITPESLAEFVKLPDDKKRKMFNKGLVFHLGSFRNSGLLNNEYLNEKEYPVLTFGGQPNQKFDIGSILAVSTSGNAGLKYKKDDLNYFKGFVPNFSNPLFEAFRRENSATATLGFSPRVSSPQNPMGAMVYDRSYQRNPEQAIRQHLAIGQTDLKNMGKAQGFVPNFAIADSLALGALQGTFNNMSGALNPLSFHYNKQIELVRKMNEQFAKLNSQILAGGVVKYNGKEYNNLTSAGGVNILANMKEFLRDFRTANPNFGSGMQRKIQTQKQNEAYDVYHAQVQKTQAKIGTYATYGMVGGPLAFETAASVAKNFGNPNLSKGLEMFSEGVTMSGQLLSTFPNKLGVMLASSELIKSASDAVSLGVSKFGKFEKAYDLASTKAEKMASAGNTVIETFERLKNASTDATVTLDEYQSLQEKYAKSLADLASIRPDENGKNGGAEIVQKLATAPTAEMKQKIIAQAIDLQNQAKGEMATRMQLAQLNAQNSVFGFNYGSRRAGGVFAATNDVDALEKQTLLASTAVQMEQGALNSDNLPKGFAERMKKAALTDEDVAAVTKEASKSPILESLDKNSIAQVMKQFAYEIGKFKMPAGVSSDEWTQHLETLNELNAKELSLRLKYNQELQNVLQKGSILSNFALVTGAGNIESKYRNKAFATFTSGKENDLASLTTSESSMIVRRGNVKAQEIRNQVSGDLERNYNRGAGEINAALGRTITDAITGGLQMTGQKQDVAALSEARIKASSYLSSRQQLYAQNPQGLINLAKNPESFGATFLGSKKNAEQNGITSAMYDTIANRLSTAVNGQQSTITQVLEETKQINERGLDELARLGLEQIAALKEARFSELAQGIKGMDELARGGARRARRELRRDEYALNHSRSAIRRGEAARDLLNYIPSDERDYNNPQIRRLYDTAQSGSRAAYNYIFRGTSLQNYGHSDERSFARTFGNYKGVNTPSLGFTEAEKNNRDAAMSLNVATANSNLDLFGNKLNDIGLSLDNFKKALQGIIDAKKTEGERFGQLNNAPETSAPSVPRTSGFMDGLKQYALPAIPWLIMGASLLRRGRGAMPSPAGMTVAASSGSAGSAISSAVTRGTQAGAAATATKTVTQAVQEAAKASSVGAVSQASKQFQLEFSLRNSKGQFYMGGKAAQQAVENISPERQIDRVANAIKKGQKVSIMRGGEEVAGLSNLKGKSIGQIKNVLSGLGYTPEYLNSLKGAGAAAAGAAPAAGAAAEQMEFLFNTANKVAPTASRFAGLKKLGGMSFATGSMNPLAGWKGAGWMGKGLRVGGVLGAGLGAYNAYNQARSGDYSGAAVGLGTTALSFAGPIGLVGSIGVNAVNAEANKLRQYHAVIGQEKGRGIDLDNKLMFIKKYGSQYKSAVNKGINATAADKTFMENYERATGATSFRTKSAVIQKQATDFFNEKKDAISKNLIHPIGTYEKNGYVFGYTGRGSSRMIGRSSDANKAEEIKAYTEKEEARRNAEISNLSRSKQGLAYLEAQNQRAAKYAEDLTLKKFLPEKENAAEQAHNAPEAQKPQPQEVKISAEPATVVVKLTGADGNILQTILTKLAFVETQVNALQGTPKPASVNQMVSQ